MSAIFSAYARSLTIRGLALFCIALFAACSGAAFGDDPQYAMRVGKPKSVTATLTYELEVPEMDVKLWTFFVAAAPELSGQTKVRTTIDPRGVLTDDLRVRDRKLQVVKFSSAGSEHRAKVTVTYQAALAPRDLIHVLAATPPAVPSAIGARDATAANVKPSDQAKAPTKGKPAAKPIELAPNDRKLYLAASEWSNHTDATFSDLLDANNLRRGDEESEIGFARRVFAFAKSRGKYTMKPDGDKSVAAVAKNYKTDCCGWSNWFVAVMRAGRVPARSLVGRWATSAESGDRIDGERYSQEHVRAEFFVTGIGWIPVDVSQAVQHDGGRENWRYFGHDRGDFLTMHTDVDFEVSTKEAGKKQFHALQLPAWHVTGKGTIKGWSGTHAWRVVEQPTAVADAKEKGTKGGAIAGNAKGAAKPSQPARVPPPPAAAAGGE